MLLRLLPLALATFAVGTDGFVIAGLLPGIAADLDVGIPAAGQLVTAFALTFAITAPVFGALISAIDRRRALLIALTVFTAGNAATALAPNYPLALAARVVTAIGAGMINSTASSTAAALAEPHERGRALAIAIGGFSIASVLGLPLGTLIGAADWRITMWAVAGLSLLAIVGIAVKLPAVVLPPSRLADRLAPLRDRTVLGIVATSMLAVSAINVVFTYLTTALAGATRGSAGLLTVLLLIGGVGSVAGTVLAGRLVDRFDPRRVMLASVAVIVVVLASGPLAIGTVAGAAVWAVPWGICTGLPVVPQQHRLLSLAPASGPVVLGLNSASIYAGSALGGALGGLALHWIPADRLGLPAAGVGLIALAFSWLIREPATAAALSSGPGPSPARQAPSRSR